MTSKHRVLMVIVGFCMSFSSHELLAQETLEGPLGDRFACETFVSQGLAVFDLLVADAGSDSLRAVPPGEYRVTYWWAPERRWRIEVAMADGGSVTTLICDGKHIDTGCMVWEAGYLYEFLSGADKRRKEFDTFLWPHEIVASRHLFPITYGHTITPGTWQFGQDLEYGGPVRESDGRVVRSLFRRPKASFADTVAPEPPRDNASAAGPGSVRERATTLVDALEVEYTFDVSNGCMPLSERPVRAAQAAKLGIELEAYVWEEPCEVKPGVYFPRVCKRVSVEEGNKELWVSRLVLERSDFRDSPQYELFRIDDTPGKTQVCVLREGMMDKTSKWLSRVARRVGRVVNRVAW